MLCDDLEGWDGSRGGRLKREGIYVQLWLIHVVWQKPHNTVKQLSSNFFFFLKEGSIGSPMRSQDELGRAVGRC